jgi:hypothetical protein
MSPVTALAGVGAATLRLFLPNWYEAALPEGDLRGTTESLPMGRSNVSDNGLIGRLTKYTRELAYQAFERNFTVIKKDSIIATYVVRPEIFSAANDFVPLMACFRRRISVISCISQYFSLRRDQNGEIG